MVPAPRSMLGLLLLLGSGAAGAQSARAGDGPSKPVLRSQVLLRLAPTAEEGAAIEGQTMAFSEDGRHVAWRSSSDAGVVWTIDGQAGATFAETGPLVFGALPGRWGHLARAAEGYVLVSDDGLRPVKGKPLLESLEAARVGRRFAYLVEAPDPAAPGSSIVLDDVPGPARRWKPESVAFSPDGSRAAGVASEGEAERVVVDARAQAPYPAGAIGRPRFSADGQHVAYAVGKPRALVVVDGKEGPAFDSVTEPRFAPAGARCAYAAVRGTPRVVVDGKEDPEVVDVLDPGPVFSPDGAHVGYAALTKEGLRMILDGKPGPVFQRVGAESLRFSPDGTHHAYWAANGPRPFYVIDGVPQPEVDLVGQGESFRFSPDSKHSAYSAQRNGTWVVVTDGVEGPATDGIGAGFPVYSPDSQHVVYEAVLKGRWHVVKDGQPGPAFDGFAEGAFAFGGDGATFAVAARREGTWRLVVEGLEGEAYPVHPRPSVRPDGPASFHTWFLEPPGTLLHVRAALPR